MRNFAIGTAQASEHAELHAMHDHWRLRSPRLTPEEHFEMVSFDCIVVGSGHAGSCAAISAVESGCSNVLVVDKCPEKWVGGNGYFTAGAHRTVHEGLPDLLTVVPNLSSLAGQIDVDPYTADQFIGDIQRLSNGQSDKRLSDTVVLNSRETIGWLKESIGVPFTLSFNRQAYVVEGRQKFWGGMALAVEGGGKGLISAHHAKLKDIGVEVWFDSKAVELLHNVHEGVKGVVVERCGKRIELTAYSVILAAGGFEANADMRREHLGPGWEKARVRGTPYNTGDGFHMVKFVGGRLTGDWKGCHSTAWDANTSPVGGDRELTNQFTKSGYPLGIMVNAEGLRFVDEGEDYRNYTYAKFGRAILEQTGGYAFQIWDSKVTGYLREEEYAEDVVERIAANNLKDLAAELAVRGLEDPEAFVQTITEFNDAAAEHRREHYNLEWNPAVKDGLSTQSKNAQLTLPKSNWALPIDKPPFVAVKVACGITFTFGGVAIDAETAGVLSMDGNTIDGLYCTGEMVGGLFYGNYPGGSGLTAGAVFGRKAGKEAGRRAVQPRQRM